MDKVGETKQVICDLERMLKQRPLSEATATELNRKVDELRKKLNEQQSQLVDDALNELTHVQRLVTNPVAATLFAGLLNILKDRKNPSNSHLIQTVLQISDPSPSASVESSHLPRVSIAPISTPPAPEPEVRHVPVPVIRASVMDRNNNSKQSKKKDLPSKELNIWNVLWDNDIKYVRIYLPMSSNTGSTMSPEKIKCNMVLTNLGHLLNINYPGCKFSVLINHRKIKNIVEVRVSDSVTIRLTKTEPLLWPYITFLTFDEESNSATYHLNSQTHVKVDKNKILLNTLREAGLDLRFDGLPDPRHFSLITNIQDNINPVSILRKCESSHYVVDGRSTSISTGRQSHGSDLNSYCAIFECRCIMCQDGLVPDGSREFETIDERREKHGKDCVIS